MGPDVIVPIAFFIMAPVTVVTIMLTRAYVKRSERGALSASPMGEVNARLERMEQAMDAIAVEIERISEAQRFTTRLLSERTAERIAAPGRPEHTS